MTAATHELTFNGAVLARGFWLYAWEITTTAGDKVYYVGRTGDSSSTNAQSPFSRLSQHLGTNKNSNALRRHLENAGIDPVTCANFRLVTHGPVYPETKDAGEHGRARDEVAALEKALAKAMSEAGYNVLNTVTSQKSLDIAMFDTVRAAFAASFPALSIARRAAGNG